MIWSQKWNEIVHCVGKICTRNKTRAIVLLLSLHVFVCLYHKIQNFLDNNTTFVIFPLYISIDFKSRNQDGNTVHRAIGNCRLKLYHANKWTWEHDPETVNKSGLRQCLKLFFSQTNKTWNSFRKHGHCVTGGSKRWGTLSSEIAFTSDSMGLH